MLAAGIAVFGASHPFAEHTSQMYWFCWNSESYIGSDRQQTPDSNHELFLVQIWPSEVLWSLFLVHPLSWSLPVVI